MMSRLPLRVSLVLVITVLGGLGLLVSGGVVTGTMNRFMVSRIDDQLTLATGSWAHTTALGEPASPDDMGSYDSRVGPTRPPSEFVVVIAVGGEFYSVNGSMASLNSIHDSGPELAGLDEPTRPVTVPARAGSADDADWRAASVRNGDGSVTIVALPLASEEHTIRQLIILQMLIGSIVLVSLVVASLYLVRRALRPLHEVEYTAQRIAQGQLDQRVPAWSPRTEVGRLAVALNRMLAQIQGSFIAVGASERQARQAESAMRRFIGDASHELRTPLTSVRGYAELYTSGATDDANMVVGRIADEAGRMSLLVEDLMALVRMDEGRPLRREKVDMLELCLHVVESARAGFPGHRISVRNNAEGVPVVTGDPDRLHQVVGNLVTNAVRHGGPGTTVTVTLSTGDGQVFVEVADDGRGIAPEDLPHLFERFYRADVSRSRASGGSGLGLSIVKGLVEAHGGDVSVTSTVGEGTTFVVRLPGRSGD
ncbi:sensor histidine kinase [Corynebacterium bovis]|uniref:histidine kinase n=2 Tax=Corynebacterium bovis TaxID=36808 RepID=A0A3R8PCV5_9CORY|nr:HAMP domain-containing sensor histidine kinase [Corynebacterium bovis]WJY78216.1 putative sensor histidine kinase TcrY [Corynebacterium bovis DSM 20582 = CIP 54.80]MDK8509990.1 HAMP domain-containing sensor histidine kinase [Corynebacterium bovis]QQC48293.1 HAMP domain-containing histidine kinase [Corynebacterium bovis]RRO87401.1 sensor histidine kinase [Corynebacterium bovis]RRO90521.1 sensor histidine kinase [Corynebacterium bovis]